MPGHNLASSPSSTPPGLQAEGNNIKQITARWIAVENLTYSTIKLLGLGLGFVTSLVLARLGSLELVGYYALVLSLVNLGSVLANLGLNNIIVRELAAPRDTAGRFVPAQLVAWCNTRKTLATACLLTVAMLLQQILQWQPLPELNAVLVLITLAAIILLGVVAESFTASLLALGRKFDSQWIGLVLKPALTLGVVLAACSSTVVKPLSLILLGMVAVGTVILLILVVANYRTPQYQRGERQAIPGSLLASGSNLLGAQLMFTTLANLGVLLVTWLIDAEAAGAYHICMKLAAIANVSLMMSNTIKAPLYARLYKEQRIAELKVTVKDISRNITLLTLGFAVPMMLGGKWLLGIWDSYYGNYANCLSILLLAYLIDAAFGPGGRLLVMTAREQLYLRSVTAVGTVSILLGVVLVSRYGVTGAALSYLVWVTALNLVWAWLLKQQLGFTPLMSLNCTGHCRASNS